MKLNSFLIFEIIIVKTFPIFSLFLFKKIFIDPNYILPEKRNIKVLNLSGNIKYTFDYVNSFRIKFYSLFT